MLMAYVNPVPYRKDTLDSPQGQRLYRMLEKYIRFPASSFHIWDKRPNCGYFFTGCGWYGNDQNQTAALMAILYRFGSYDEGISGVPRGRLREMAIQALRYACFTHDTGPADCVRVEGKNKLQSGTKWGGNVVTWPGLRPKFFQASQVGYGLSRFGMAAWLLWDELDEETRQMAYNTVTDYAERWAEYEPRDGVYYNTQAEENGWTGLGLFAAAVIFRDDPRSKKWRDGALRWMQDAVTTPLDMQDPIVLEDGVPLRQRSDHITFHPDYTTENHAVVHPNYMNAPIHYRAVMQALAELAGEGEIPGIRLNIREIYDNVFKVWADTCGGAIPVQSQDWWYLRTEETLASSAMTASFFDDPDAALMETMAIDAFEKAQADHPSGMFIDSEGKQSISDQFQLQSDFEPTIAGCLAVAMLLHFFRGAGPAPSTRAQFESHTDRAKHYRFGGIVVNRTARALSHVSYRNSCLAAVLPEDKLWTVTVPPCSIFGEIRFAEGSAQKVYPANLDRVLLCDDPYVACGEHDFCVSTSFLRGGCLRQDVFAVSLPDGRTVFLQAVQAVRDCTIEEFTWGLVGVRNDCYPLMDGLAKGYRELRVGNEPPRRMQGFVGGEDEIFDFAGAHCAAIEDHISYAAFGGGQIRYVGHHKYPKWKGIEDYLILNRYSDTSLHAGESLPHFAMLCLPNTGIGEAEKAYEASCQAFAGTAEALIWDDLLIFGWRQTRRGRARADFRPAWDRLPLFEGETHFRDGVYTWNASLEAGETGYRKAAAFVPADRPFDAIVTSDQTVLIRYDGESAYSPIQ